MKTKSTLRNVMPILAALLVTPAFSQSLIFGFHNFDGTTGNETPDSVIPGMSTLLVKSALGSSATGGSSDGFYGDSAISTPVNNGFARLTNTSGNVEIQMTNNTGFEYILETLLFDARVIVASAAGQVFAASYAIDGGTPIPLSLNTSVASGGAPTLPETQDYTDFRSPPIGNDSISLPNSSVLSLFFSTTGANQVGLDNIALLGTKGAQDPTTIIPEPSSLLALGCLISSGLAFRSRRRKVLA